MDRILTVGDVAEILKVKAITVREMFRERRLRAFKVGKAWRTTERMLEEDIDAIARGAACPPIPGAAPQTASPPAVGRTERVQTAGAPGAKLLNDVKPPDDDGANADAPPPKRGRRPAKAQPLDDEVEDDTAQQLLF